jgi:acyl-CoA synthetase (AMP-forming)/AMP-acid ligase II
VSVSDTTVSLLRDLARHDPSGRAGYRFLDAGERETWHDMATQWHRATHVAGGLRAAGLGHGDVVALMLPTSPGFLDAWFGCQILGAVPVALYPPVRLGRLDEFFDRTDAMLGASGAVALVTEPRVRRVLGRLVERRALPRGVHDVADLLAATEAVTGPLPDADHLAMIQFSSGTTVHPKPVALTHRQILSNAAVITDVIVRADPLDGPSPAAGVSWLPLYHDMGLIGCVLPALLAPGPLTLLPPEVFLARPAVWLRALSRYRGTISPAPSFAFALATERVRDEELDGVDLSCWTLALNGAEPISVPACEAFLDRFARWGLPRTAIVPVYGLSEMSLAVTFGDTRAELPLRRWSVAALAEGRAEPDAEGVTLVDVGRPLPGYAVQIRAADGQPAPEGEVGRVWCAGPSRMERYLDRAEQPFDGAWLDTGDLGFVYEGRLTITGRAKDVLVLRGRNHAPQDLERAADAVDGVRTGCAAAVADVGPEGERALMFVEVRQAREGLADAISDAVLARAGVRPDLVVLLAPGTLPRTSSGKIRRAETLARWRAGTLTPPDQVDALHLAGTLARSALGWVRAWARAR